MPRRIPEQQRQLAMKCKRLADSCADKNIANELEGVRAELAQIAQSLDDLFNHIESAS